MADLTQAQALALAETGWWKGKDCRLVCDFQLFQDRLCMDFKDFHLALEDCLGREVHTLELSIGLDSTKREYLGEKRPPIWTDLVAAIPELKQTLDKVRPKDNLDFKSLRLANDDRARRWHPPGSQPWTSADWSNALCGEAGELANVVKKLRRHETGVASVGAPSSEVLMAMAAEEIADVVIYADLVARHLGVDLAAAVRAKFNKVSEKYGFPERL